jgi:putative FmdB family regulatory protein
LPIYEYRCEACGHTFEVMQKFADAPVETCGVCGGQVVKVLHPVAIHFRGSGFYTTDYGRSSKAARTGRDEGDGKAASESKEAGAARESDAKGDAKGDEKAGSSAKDTGGAGAAAKTGTG